MHSVNLSSYLIKPVDQLLDLLGVGYKNDVDARVSLCTPLAASSHYIVTTAAAVSLEWLKPDTSNLLHR